MSDINKNTEESEINLLELAQKLWSKKKFIIKVSLIGLIVGIIVAFSIPKEYTSTVILTTTESGKSAGSMGALASMAGINLGGGSNNEILSPELYPDVLNSTPFVQGLLSINVADSKQNINTTLYNYIKEDQKIPWWNYIAEIPKSLLSIGSSIEDQKPELVKKNKYFISKEEMDIIEFLKSSYSIQTDKKSKAIIIEFTSQSPKISAYLSDTLVSYLQEYIIEQRTKKAKTDLENSEKLYKNAKIDYYKAQQNLAAFIDGNINVISAKFRTNQEKLQNEANLAYSVYNQMAQQVQMNKIKIQDETPVFTTIQPAIEPLYPSKPKKKVLVATCIFLSLIGACGWALKDDLMKMLK